MGINWIHVQGLASRAYVCGYCGAHVASDKGYLGKTESGNASCGVYICHQCSKPSFIDFQGRATPGVAFGNPVSDTEASVGALYEEARRAYSAGSFTAVVLCCRKLLMHVAVSKGASPGDSFVMYVQYLADQNFVPPDAKPWVDHLRTRGNEANHEITLMCAGDAAELLEFSEMLLKLVFQYPAAMSKKYAKKP
jgi:hypothetical protein